LAAERTIRSGSALRFARPTVPDAWPPRPNAKRAAVAVGALAGACAVLAALAVVQRHALGQRADAADVPQAPVPAVAPPRPDPQADLVVPAPVPVDSRTVANGSTNAPRYGSQPRWAPPPSAQRASRYDVAEPARPTSPSADAPAGATPAAHQEVDPAGGRAPLRPIMTANPYGAP
jgi:hypothetical protein